MKNRPLSDEQGIMLADYPGMLIPLKRVIYSLDRGTWQERWFIDSYQTEHGTRWGAYRAGVRLSGYDSADAVINQLKTRAN